jgi:hypothetical protein
VAPAWPCDGEERARFIARAFGRLDGQVVHHERARLPAGFVNPHLVAGVVAPAQPTDDRRGPRQWQQLASV